LSFVIGLDGIGTTGDNVNPTFTSGVNNATINGTQVTNNFGGSTPNPLTPQRTLNITLLNSSNQAVTVPSAQIIYDSQPSDANYGRFVGTADLGSSFTTGNYTVKVTTDAHLTRRIGDIQLITAGTTNPMSARLIAGDITEDNKLTIEDYNILLSCSKDPSITNPDNGALCAQNANYAKLSDLDDNGTVDMFDYNLFLREYSVQNGD